MKIVLVGCKDMLTFEFATFFLPWVAVMCVLYCIPRKDSGDQSLTIPAREINNQVSLPPTLPPF